MDTPMSFGETSGVESKHKQSHVLPCPGTMAPSMKTGTYKLCILLGREGDFATACSARHDCAAG